MLNLLRMNLYRMLHARSMWVLLILTVSLSVFSAIMSTVSFEQVKEQKMQVQEEATEGTGSFGIYIQTPESETGEAPPFLRFYTADLASGFLLIMLIIAVVLFVNGEDKSGFVKNIAGQTKNKYQLYLSKTIILAGYTLLNMLAYGVGQYVTLKLYYPNMVFGAALFSESLLLFGMDFLLYMAFVSGLIMLTSVFRNSAVGITAGMLTACGFGRIISGFVEKIFQLDINPYFIISNINSMQNGVASKNILTAFLCGAAFFLLYNFLGAILFQKRDIV